MGNIYSCNKKSLVFPRFYFLDSQSLLMLLAQTKDPREVQVHMDKCFEGISRVKFSDSDEVYGMISAEGEQVEFKKRVDVNAGDKKGNVEKWMLEIETVMRMTLKQLNERGYATCLCHSNSILRIIERQRPKCTRQLSLHTSQIKRLLGSDAHHHSLSDATLLSVQ